MQAYHGKRASVCRPRSTVLVLLSVVILLHIILCMLQWERGGGGGSVPSPLFSGSRSQEGRPGGSKIVLVGPSCPSRVLRGGEATGYGRRAAIGGRVQEGGVPPPAQSAED